MTTADDGGQLICQFIEGIGGASKCVACKSHTPKPLRFVWHHILPRVCGGQTVQENLAEVCDNCHYGIHVLLYERGQNGGHLTAHGRLNGTGRDLIAEQGYQAAVAAGTVAVIPNEGSD